MSVCGSLLPLNDNAGLVSWIRDMDYFSNTTLYPWSTNWVIESRALVPISGKRWHCRATKGMLGLSRRAVCNACIVMLFGSLTMTPFAHVFVWVQRALSPRK